MSKQKKPTTKKQAPPVTTQETALILRTCSADMTSYGGFQWPTSGPVECAVWNPKHVCGNGLHGLLWGEGSISYLDLSESAKWIVFRAALSDIATGSGDLIDKCKARAGVVEYCGDRPGAIAYLLANGACGKAVVFGTATAGYSGTATAGNYGTATAGDSGTATAGDSGIICIRWYDSVAIRYRLAIAYVGENGIKANTKYRLNDHHQFEESKNE